jgi:hypothetical protein
MMGEIIMLSNRTLLFTVLAIYSWVAAAADQIACPQQHTEGRTTGQLIDASVFDGAPKNLVDLMPNLETSEWDLSLRQKDAERRGDSMYLVCHYESIRSTVQIKIPYSATTCKVEGVEHGIYAGCSSSSGQGQEKSD